MRLIKFENYTLTISEEAYLIKPIRDLFNADKSKTKETFFQQMSYLYFFTDVRSPYADIADIEERSTQIIKQEGLPEDFKPSTRLLEAMSAYELATETSSSKALKSMKIALNKVREFLENVDLFEEDDKGKPKFDVGRIASTMDKVPSLAKKLIETEQIVNTEILEVGRARGGNNSKKVFEDGA